MAEEHKLGTMDISQHKALWTGFTKLTTWSCVALAIALLLMAKFLVH